MIHCEKNLTYYYYWLYRWRKGSQVKDINWLQAAENDEDMVPSPEPPEEKTALPTSGFYPRETHVGLPSYKTEK